MIKKFTVSNFKGFKDEFVFDLSDTNNYNFNTESIKEGVVNNAVVYGKNGVGKSNLGFAIFDIVKNLTDKETSPKFYDIYLNVYHLNEHATFKYEFLIDEVSVVYEYKKYNYHNIFSEKFTVGGKHVASIERKRSNKAQINFKGAEHLNRNIGENVSLLRYIKNNAILEDCKVSNIFYRFFEVLIWP